MTPGNSHYRLRPQAEVEARLLALIEQLPHIDHTNEERVSWHCGQLTALLFALGADQQTAIDAMYRLWRSRGVNSDVS